VADVRCEHLVRQFAPGVRAVSDVSLDIADGELVVLVGPSGCGKSTLLRIVAGLETADSGRVWIGGRDVSNASPPERNVAMVFQDYALYPHMTVRRNLEFPLRVRGDAAADRDASVERIAAMLGLGPLLDRFPKALSGGQRQRVAMGRALVREPAVSLLDEPLSNLDAKLRSEVRAEIADLQRRTRTTMLYVTHDQTEAMTLGHRVVVLDRGVLQQAAPPAELYDRPANAFVAGFIGNPPMNLLPVRMVESGFACIAGTRSRVRVDRSGVGAASMSRVATIGIRPEALAVVAANDAAAMPAMVEHVELLGHETLVHCRLDSDARGGDAIRGGDRRGDGNVTPASNSVPAEPVRIVARMTGAHHFEPEQPISIAADETALHAFAADGRRL
jgi:multiple sugar transport system ATP-binding protein